MDAQVVWRYLYRHDDSSCRRAMNKCSLRVIDSVVAVLSAFTNVVCICLVVNVHLRTPGHVVNGSVSFLSRGWHNPMVHGEYSDEEAQRFID